MDEVIYQATDAASTPNSLGRRERKKAETKRRLIEVATELFWKNGYEETSVTDITEEADVSPATFYLHFESKADVALVQFSEWLARFVAIIESRPEGENPPEMLAGTFAALGGLGFTSGSQLRDGAGRPISPIVIGLLMAETSPDLAGRIDQIIVGVGHALTALFRERLGYPPGSMEPRIIASALFAAWRAAVFGFGEMVEAGLDPPPPNELALQAFAAYTTGMQDLWANRP
jgi:AcrR family transcriptional regulator